jgi:hypothetical protein
MSLRSCSQCGDPAVVSLCHLLSTVAVTPRKQKCGTAIPYCSACIQRLLDLLSVSEYLALQELSQPLSEAYTALATPSERDSDGKTERQW